MIVNRKKYIEPSEHRNKEDVIEWLMEEYGRSVVRLAFTYTKQAEMAEDIAQEVFMKCFQNLDTFRHEASYKTWIYRITVNLCKDRLKSWSYRNIVLSEFFSASKITKRTPETELLELEKKRQLSEKVLSLPVKYREIIILYYYEGLSYNEVAALLSVSQETVKSRLYRGRQLLKKKLEGGRMDG